jgi:hypothetical protein
MEMIKTVLAFIIAVLLTFLLTSVAGTQIVFMDIQSFGLDVPSSDRLSATLHDIVGLAPTLSVLIAVALLIAFLVAALGNRYLGGNRTYWYLVAGFTSLPVTLILIKSIMGSALFAAAGTGFGMFIIALCGLLGGYLFARLTRRREVE